MNKTTTYNIDAELSITVVEGDEKVEVAIGKRSTTIYWSDLMAFCVAFVGTDKTAEAPTPDPVVSRRKEVLADFDDRKAVSASPLKTITMDEWNKIERAPTPVPGVSFSGAVNMPAPTSPSFKK